MRMQTWLAAGFVAAALPSLHAANPEYRQATIVGGGGGGWGRCTVEVNVDDTAEVEISGDGGSLRTLTGQPSTWRRFQCTSAIPRNVGDMDFVAVKGRGTMQMVGDPRRNRGRAVVHIDDPQPGRANYIFELRWRTRGGGWTPGPPSPPAPPVRPVPPPAPGPWPGPGRFPMAKAIQRCQDAVTDRLTRDGYPNISFDRIVPDSSPGRNDWVIGSVTGRRSWETTRFAFSCSVDFNTGRIRTVDVSRRER